MNEKELEKEIRKVYARASKEMTEKMKAYLKQFEAEIDLMSQKVEAGEITERYFKKWKRDKIMLYNQWHETREKISDVLLDADMVSRDLIKGALPTVMADGINRTFYELEQIREIGDMGVSFQLTDENTVKRLIAEHPRLLPVLDEESETARMIREGKAIRWNQQHITSEITQGIVQGEPMGKIAERMMNVTGMNYRSAIRNARTATGGAYNAGRIEGMKQAEEKGVKMLKRWSAIFDDKTRDEHRLLDGVTIPIDEKFEIDGYELDYPRDPNGEPEMIYNCRCRLVSVPALIADTYDEIFDKDGQTTASGQTYEEWKQGKKSEKETEPETETRSGKEPEPASAALTPEKGKEPEPENAELPVPSEPTPKNEPETNTASVVNGQDLTGTWVRRPEEFDFEIEDIINAQGFDGLPQVVTPKEFEKAVNESNFIAQRTYSAPDQETLDSYREQLYKGKWYVDCSTGGSALGKGMYSVYSNGTSISDHMQSEIKGYAVRRGIDFNYIETFTLTPDAKTVTPRELVELRQQAHDKVMQTFQDKGGWGNSDALEWAKAHDVLHMDDGALASLLGYDAILTDDSISYAVILNRTKCIFKKGG